MVRPLVGCGLALLAAAVQAEPQRLIIDTDMGFDVDDVGAVCLANALQDAGKVNILAVVHDTGCELGIGGVSAINHFYGRDNITLGAWKGKFGSDCDQHYDGTNGQNQYLSTVIRKMGGPVKSSKDVMSGTDAYRKALAAVPGNSSVNIASIGMTTNLADLLKTPADKYSSMTGFDLVAAKVDKVVFMDGGYNFGCAAGLIGPADECYGTAQQAVKMPPSVSMIFSGAGENPDIYTGAGLQTSHPDSSPCREAYKHWCCNPNGKPGTSGRLSWDPIAVMIAGLGVESVFEKYTDQGTQVTADANGREHFAPGKTKNARTGFDTDDPVGKISRAIDAYLNVPPGAQPQPSPGGKKFEIHQGKNCYGNRDGRGSHGATDLEHPATSSCGNFDTLAECESKCLELSDCDGVTVTFANGKYECFRKGNIDLSKCDSGTGFDTYTLDAGTAAVSAARIN